MTPVRLFFDECLSRPVVVRQLTDSLRLYGSKAEVAHLLNKFSSGELDRVWIPQLAEEGGWIVITADAGKNSSKSEKLPLICAEYEVTHVVLAQGLHKRNMHYKSLAIQSHWQSILEAGEATPGTGYSLAMHGSGFRFRKKSDPTDAASLTPRGPVRQKGLDLTDES